MSDDEDGAPLIKKQWIHFGSLEAVERERLAAGPSTNNDDDKEEEEDNQEGEDSGMSAAVLAGIRAGNINITDGKQFVIIMEGSGKLDIAGSSVMLSSQEVFRPASPSFGLPASKPSKTTSTVRRKLTFYKLSKLC